MSCGGMRNLILDSSNKQYVIQCATAPTEELHITANWYDWYKGIHTIGNMYGQSDGVNLSVVVDSINDGKCLSREVTSMSVYNPNADPVTFYLCEYDADANEVTVIVEKTLGAYETWTNECICTCCGSGGGGGGGGTQITAYLCNNTLGTNITGIDICGCGVTASYSGGIATYNINPTISYDSQTHTLSICNSSVDLGSLSDLLTITGCYREEGAEEKTESSNTSNEIDFDCCAFNVEQKTDPDTQEQYVEVKPDYNQLTFDYETKTFYRCGNPIFDGFADCDFEETTVKNTVFVMENGNDSTGLVERFDRPFRSISRAVQAGRSAGRSEVNVIVYPGRDTVQGGVGTGNYYIGGYYYGVGGSVNIYLNPGVKIAAVNHLPALCNVNVVGHGELYGNYNLDYNIQEPGWIYMFSGYLYDNYEIYIHFDKMYLKGGPINGVSRAAITIFGEVDEVNNINVPCNVTIDSDETYRYRNASSANPADYYLVRLSRMTNVDISLGKLHIEDKVMGYPGTVGMNLFKIDKADDETEPHHHNVYFHDTTIIQDGHTVTDVAGGELLSLFTIKGIASDPTNFWMENVEIDMGWGGFVAYTKDANVYIKNFSFHNRYGCVYPNHTGYLFTSQNGSSSNDNVTFYGSNEIYVGNQTQCLTHTITNICNTYIFGWIYSNVADLCLLSLVPSAQYTFNSVSHYIYSQYMTKAFCPFIN